MDNTPNQTQIIFVLVQCAVVLVIAIGALLILRVFVKRMQSGQGPFGSVLQQSRELTKETLVVARERLQVERDLLTAQKETNGLLKEVITRLDKKT